MEHTLKHVSFYWLDFEQWVQKLLQFELHVHISMINLKGENFFLNFF